MTVQGTQEWHMERCGCATASRFAEIMTGKKGRADYLNQLVAERLSLTPTETYSNWHTRRGNEQEPVAKVAYMAKTAQIIEEVGFIRHPALKAGASPDGLVEDDGGIEIKSVIPTVQLATIESGSYPQVHKPQIQGNLWITGRKWWDFVSFCYDMREGLNPDLQLYIFRVERDESYIDRLEIEVSRFLREIDEKVESFLSHSF